MFKSGGEMRRMKMELRNAALAWLNHDETAPVRALAYCELARRSNRAGGYLSGVAENETASLPRRRPGDDQPCWVRLHC